MSDFMSRYFTNTQKPDKLLVFLHGYNNTRQEMSVVYDYLMANCPNIAIFAPEGTCQSLKDKDRYSWYKISDFDNEGRRLLDSTPVEDIAKIYNQAGNALLKNATELNGFIDEVQKRYDFTDNNTYIAGFSQGAMLAIWTALIRPHKLAGCFSFSGLAAANELLDTQIRSKPRVYLLHGTADQQVLFKCMQFTAQWLSVEKVPVETKSFEKLDHKIINDELDFMIEKVTSTL